MILREPCILFERYLYEIALPNLHLEFHTRNVMPTSWKLFDVIKFQEEVKVAQNSAVELL